MSSITLYPSNWLYNAGVVGLFSVRENAGEPVQKELLDDGSAQIHDGYFKPMQINKKEISKAIVNLVNVLVSQDELTEWLNETNKNKYQNVYEELGEFGFKFIRAGNKLFASKTPYQNLVQLKEWQSYEYPELVKEIPNLISFNAGNPCSLCARYPVFIRDPRNKLQERLCRLQSTHLKNLGPSLGEFPNGFWGLNESIGICYLCSFVIIHHHLAFTRLSDGSEIFINAPSFQVMYYLNKFVHEVFGALSAEEMRNKRNILATSVIEYATKVQATLGVWTGMNIEVVSKYRVKKDDKWQDKIEFFSLPYEVVQLLSDRRIAGLLSQIGEFSIMNRVLDQDFSRLMETGYRLLRIGLKAYGERGKSENDFINQTLRLEKNRRDPARVADQIFELCALIEEKQNRRKAYEHIYGS